MILPTKRLGEDRALITIAAEVLEKLYEPKTVSRLWEEVRLSRTDGLGDSLITYDWFVLSLDLLNMLGVVDLRHGRLVRVNL